MHAQAEGSQSISTVAMDELMKIASEGPRPQEERWRDRQFQDMYQDLAHLDARCNALAEIVRRLRHATPIDEFGVPLPLPLGGQHAAPVDERGPGPGHAHAHGSGHAVRRPVPETHDEQCLADCAGLLSDVSKRLIMVAEGLAARYAGTHKPAA